MGAPKNEVGAPVPLRLILGRTYRVAVALVGATAYTTGVSLTVSVRRRESLVPDDFDDIDEFYDDPFEPPFGHPGRRRRRARELAPEILRFRVQFSDGRKATTTGELFPWVDLDETEEREPTGPPPEASSDETSRSRHFVIETDSAASEPDPDEDERETLDESD